MKIIDARDGSVMAVAQFNLGEAGRGRHLEEVRIDNRNPPRGSEVGYKTFGGDPSKGYLPHVVLTADSRQRGILVRISTRGCYTKGSCGSVGLKGGDATLLTEGRWAEGDAGNVANGPDQLWHVRGPAVFAVKLQGGEHKGYGPRYVVVTKSLKVVMMKPADLCQLIAVDDDPSITETVRKFAAELGEDVRLAIKVADELEEAADAPAMAVNHFTMATIADVLARWNVAVPAAFDGILGGVSGIQAGTIMPGTKALLATSIGPNGGRRYGYTVLMEEGVTRLASERNHKGTAEELLATVDPDWRIAYESRRDGEVIERVLLNAGGTHRYIPVPDERWNESAVSTEAWPGHEPVTPSLEELETIFGIEARETESIAVTDDDRSPQTPAPEPVAAEPPMPLSADELKARLGAFRFGCR